MLYTAVNLVCVACGYVILIVCQGMYFVIRSQGKSSMFSSSVEF